MAGQERNNEKYIEKNKMKKRKKKRKEIKSKAYTCTHLSFKNIERNDSCYRKSKRNFTSYEELKKKKKEINSELKKQNFLS